MVSDFYEDGDTSVFLKENCSLLPTSDPGIKIVDLKDIVFFGG